MSSAGRHSIQVALGKRFQACCLVRPALVEDEATAEIESLRGEIAAVKAASDQALEEARTAAAGRLEQTERTLRAEAQSRLEESEAKVKAAESERARSEGIAEQLSSELQGLVASHDEQLARLRAESIQATERARAEVTEALTAPPCRRVGQGPLR